MGTLLDDERTTAPDSPITSYHLQRERRERWKRWAAAAVAVAVVAALLSALGSADGGGSSSSSLGGATTEVAPAGEPMTEDSRAGQSGAALSTTRDGAAGDAAAGGTAAQKPASPPGPGGVPAPPAGDRIVKTGSITLTVAEGRVTPTLTALGQLGQVTGGFVASSSTQEYGDTPSGSLTLRVPVTRYDEVVAKVRSLEGVEVVDASSTADDVTSQYRDLEARLRSLRASRERFLALLARTDTISETLTVQQQVDQVTMQVEQLETQRVSLERASDLSTLNLTVLERGDAGGEAPRGGLWQAVIDAKDSFLRGLEALVRLSGPLLLASLVVGLGVLVGRPLWRRVRARMS